MLAETGPDGIQMREVSERSGVAMGTLYRYFPAKQHLLAAAMVAWNDILADRLAAERESRGSRAHGSVLDRVIDLYTRQMKHFSEVPTSRDSRSSCRPPAIPMSGTRSTSVLLPTAQPCSS